MERIPKGIYTPEFRAEAVNLVEASTPGALVIPPFLAAVRSRVGEKC